MTVMLFWILTMAKNKQAHFGINIHRAESFRNNKIIDQYSAGCQVFKSADDFLVFMELCKNHAKLYGNKFSYTLIDFRSLRRITLKRVITATTIFAAIALGWVFKPNINS
jgi:hypothetical protein